MLTDDQVASFKRDGFLLLKGFLSASEVSRLRQAGETVSRADLVSLQGTEALFADSRIVGAAERILEGPATFFGEATYQRDLMTEDNYDSGRLHHDAKGTVEHLFNRQHLPTAAPYPVVRFAFYLQDHARLSGGLKVVPGSHQIDSSEFDLSKLAYLDVPSEPGDAVLFCNKILHAAHAMRRKSHPNVGLSPPDQTIGFARQPDAFIERPLDRRVIFIDYAGGNELADVYIKSRALNPSNARGGFADQVMSGSLTALAERARLRLRLDAAVVEAVTKIHETAIAGSVSEIGERYASALPALCRQSKPWSPHFNFVPEAPEDNSVRAGLQLMGQLVPRIIALREHMKTTRMDAAMAVRVVVRKKTG